jgi:lysozyme
MIPGIDVSHWQSDIDWAEVKRSGVKFAFMKATEFPDKRTTLFVDNQFKANADGAKANGIHWGAYHYFRTHVDPVTQAKVFCETVGDFSSMPPVLDLESAGSKGERLNYKVRQFLDEVEKISSRKPIIYTSAGFWNSYMICEKRDHTDWARAYPLWLAHYTSLWPTSPYPWIDWAFWQYSDRGTLPGIKTHVDLNWFTGSEEELTEKFVRGEGSAIYSATPVEMAPAVTSPEAKTVVDVNFKGDYQEELQEPNYHQPQPGSPNSAEAKYSNQEENWIRSYFFTK